MLQIIRLLTLTLVYTWYEDITCQILPYTLGPPFVHLPLLQK